MITLQELFNKPLKYTRKTKDSVRQTYSFSTGSEKYDVDFIFWPEGNVHHDKPFWTISFIIEDDDDDGYSITGTGDELKVFSTVVKIIKDFVKKENPPALLFSAKEPNRVRLYKSMVRKIGKEFKLKMVNKETFLLIKK